MGVTGWIWRHNTTALIAELVRISGAYLDPGEMTWLVSAISESDGDAEPERWATQLFDGAVPVQAQFALDSGTDVLRIKVDADDLALREAGILIGVMQSYFLHPRG